MRIPEKSPTGEEPRSIQVPPLRKRVVTMFATLALAIVCILTGMPAATAPTVSFPGCAANISGPCAKGTYIPYASDSSALACGGECPGLCPCPSALKDDSTLDV
jgi:hypothetical protein